MPKRYSDEEKAYIVRRLKEEAAKCLDQYGIRRTTVAVSYTHLTQNKTRRLLLMFLRRYHYWR